MPEKLFIQGKPAQHRRNEVRFDQQTREMVWLDDLNERYSEVAG